MLLIYWLPTCYAAYMHGGSSLHAAVSLTRFIEGKLCNTGISGISEFSRFHVTVIVILWCPYLRITVVSLTRNGIPEFL